MICRIAGSSLLQPYIPVRKLCYNKSCYILWSCPASFFRPEDTFSFWWPLCLCSTARQWSTNHWTKSSTDSGRRWRLTDLLDFSGGVDQHVNQGRICGHHLGRLSESSRSIKTLNMFYFEIITSLQNNRKNSTENSYIPFIQIYQVLTFSLN